LTQAPGAIGPRDVVLVNLWIMQGIAPPGTVPVPIGRPSGHYGDTQAN
jgi:hypothetical protein